MKKKTTLLLTLIALLATGSLSYDAVAQTLAEGGASMTNVTCRPGPFYTLIFYDQSASTKNYASAQKMFADSLETVINRRLTCKGDLLQLFLVHEKTRGRAYWKDAPCPVEPVDLTTLPRRRKNMAKIQYDSAIQAFRAETNTTLKTFMDDSPIAPGLAGHTDLLGTLEVINEMLKRAPKDMQVTIYYLSDMFESMNGAGRRDFDRRPPTSRTEAEAWAKKDVALVRAGMDVDESRFRNVQIRVLLGELTNKNHALEVQHYWQQVFALIGFQPQNIRYN